MSAYPDIAQFIKCQTNPVILKLPPVPLSALENEIGGAVLQLLLDGNPAVSSIVLNESSFRLNAVIPFREIEVIHL